MISGEEDPYTVDWTWTEAKKIPRAISELSAGTSAHDKQSQPSVENRSLGLSLLQIVLQPEEMSVTRSTTSSSS
jgi:hypothetical protein